MLIDTHCHLDASYFDEGAEPVLARARECGVSAFVCVGVGGLAQSERAVSLASERADVVATVGIHPHDASSSSQALDAAIRDLARSSLVVAVGEIGLDYHYDHSPRDVQAEVFRRYVQIAREVKKPIVIHTRNAPEDTLAILEQENARDVGGIIHCFSEGRAFAERALDLDFDLSFSGIVTFKNATSIQEVAAWAPADRILVETDSPYLAPVPLRGKRCEPAYVEHTARFLAELRRTSMQEIAEKTSENAVRRLGPALAAAASAIQTGS
jgi:TatD DNase family protein